MNTILPASYSSVAWAPVRHVILNNASVIASVQKFHWLSLQKKQKKNKYIFFPLSQIMVLTDPEFESSVLISSDEGASYQKYRLTFYILSLLFHPTEEDWALAYSHDQKVRLCYIWFFIQKEGFATPMYLSNLLPQLVLPLCIFGSLDFMWHREPHLFYFFKWSVIAITLQYPQKNMFSRTNHIKSFLLYCIIHDVKSVGDWLLVHFDSTGSDSWSTGHKIVLQFRRAYILDVDWASIQCIRQLCKLAP